jgi:hypothetical protein
VKKKKCFGRERAEPFLNGVAAVTVKEQEAAALGW